MGDHGRRINGDRGWRPKPFAACPKIGDPLAGAVRCENPVGDPGAAPALAPQARRQNGRGSADRRGYPPECRTQNVVKFTPKAGLFRLGVGQKAIDFRRSFAQLHRLALGYRCCRRRGPELTRRAFCGFTRRLCLACVPRHFGPQLLRFGPALPQFGSQRPDFITVMTDLGS
jgi:hypothetical protein